MIELFMAAALMQAADPCNAAGRATQMVEGCPVWRLVRRNDEGRGYVDPASAVRDGDRVELTTRILADTPVDGRVYSFNTRLELRCAARTVRTLRITAFDAGGATILEAPGDRPAQRAPRDSAFAAMLDEYCPRAGQ
jgi:hypothetical protein